MIAVAIVIIVGGATTATTMATATAIDLPLPLPLRQWCNWFSPSSLSCLPLLPDLFACGDTLMQVNARHWFLRLLWVLVPQNVDNDMLPPQRPSFFGRCWHGKTMTSTAHAFWPQSPPSSSSRWYYHHQQQWTTTTRIPIQRMTIFAIIFVAVLTSRPPVLVRWPHYFVLWCLCVLCCDWLLFAAAACHQRRMPKGLGVKMAVLSMMPRWWYVTQQQQLCVGVNHR